MATQIQKMEAESKWGKIRRSQTAATEEGKKKFLGGKRCGHNLWCATFSADTMRCPKCGFRDDKVIDSRQSRDSSSIRRRRVCLQCAYRLTPYEQIERSDLRVIKRDRTHEPFDRRKLVNSLAKACEKRSISLVTLETAV